MASSVPSSASIRETTATQTYKHTHKHLLVCIYCFGEESRVNQMKQREQASERERTKSPPIESESVFAYVTPLERAATVCEERARTGPSRNRDGGDFRWFHTTQPVVASPDHHAPVYRYLCDYLWGHYSRLWRWHLFTGFLGFLVPSWGAVLDKCGVAYRVCPAIQNWSPVN